MNEFVPQNHRMIFIPLTIPPPFPLELPSVMLPLSPKLIPAAESSLNADVPEFHPRDYVPKVITNDAFEAIDNDVTESTETYIKKNSSTLTESSPNPIKNGILANSFGLHNRTNAVEILSEIKSKHTKTARKNSQNEADLNDKYPNNVTSNYTDNNTSKNSDKNRFVDNINVKIKSIKKLNNINNDINDNHNDNNSNNSNNSNNMRRNNNSIDKKAKCANTNTSSATPIKDGQQAATTEKPDKAEHTYAQMLVLIAESNPKQIQSAPGHCKHFERKNRKNTNCSREKQWSESISMLKPTNNLTTETTTSSNVAVSEWYTVRSRCRKKNPMNYEVDFERDTCSTERDDEATKNIEVVDRNCISELSEVSTIVDVPKISKRSTKSKKKPQSKKVPRKATIEKFSITEPDFSAENDSAECVKCHDNHETGDTTFISPNEVILDPAMFVAQAQPHSPMTSAPTLRRPAVKAGLVGLNKCGLNLRQQFGIFQNESDSENILLKKEEEMVIRVLEQLNVNDKFENVGESNDSNELKNSNPPCALTAEDELLDKEVADWDADRFSINAKPYQNSYSSNHFLGHFFGDNDEKRKDDLKSSFLTESTAAHTLQNNVIESSAETNLENIFNDCVHECVESVPDSNYEEEHKYVSNGHPRLYIVDTNMLEQQQQIQKTFPITAAVSHWLNQAQKEKTPDPILRMPNANCQIFNAQFDERLFMSSITIPSQENTDVDNYSTDDSVSISNDENLRRKYFNWPLLINNRKHEYFDSDYVDDADDDDDSLNFWESQSPTPPTYNSDYSSSLNYENILTSKKDFICNNIVNFDENDGEATQTKLHKMNANIKQNGAASKTVMPDGHNFVKSADVSCNIM